MIFNRFFIKNCAFFIVVPLKMMLFHCFSIQNDDFPSFSHKQIVIFNCFSIKNCVFFHSFLLKMTIFHRFSINNGDFHSFPIKKIWFSMATQNYQRVLGCTGNLSGYNGIFMMCSTFWYQPTVWEHRIKCAMFRYVKLPLGSIPTGWGPQIAQLRYGCGWFLWFMVDTTN